VRAARLPMAHARLQNHRPNQEKKVLPERRQREEVFVSFVVPVFVPQATHWAIEFGG